MSEILTIEDFNIHGDKVKLEAWLRKNEMNEILSALKLQELVKEETKTLQKRLRASSHRDGSLHKNPLFIILNKLQSLVEESKK